MCPFYLSSQTSKVVGKNQKKDSDWQFLVWEEAAGSRAVYLVSATMQLSLSHLHLEENSGEEI